MFIANDPARLAGSVGAKCLRFSSFRIGSKSPAHFAPAELAKFDDSISMNVSSLTGLNFSIREIVGLRPAKPMRCNNEQH